MLRFATLLSLMVALGPTAEAADTYQRVVAPPNVIEGLKKVAIVTQGAPWDKPTAEALGEALRTRLGHQQGIAVADAGMRSDVVDFVHHRAPANLSVTHVQDISKTHSVQAVVAVSGDGKQLSENSFNEKRVWTQTNKETGEVTSVEVTVPCRDRKVAVSMQARLWRSVDGAEAATITQNQEFVDKDCDEDAGGADVVGIRTADEMIEGALKNYAQGFAWQFVPVFGRLTIVFRNDAVIKDANKLADNGDWVGAMAAASTLLADDPYNAQAVYLMGLGLELHGRADEAAPVFAMASRLRADKVYDQAAARARSRADELNRLAAAYGIKPERKAFDGVDAIVARAKAAANAAVAGIPSKTKGTRNKRIPVFQEGDPSSAIIAQVPGGVAVRTIRKVGKYAEIQLPDGIQGWVDKRMVK